jgi:hypothetical protein
MALCTGGPFESRLTILGSLLDSQLPTEKRPGDFSLSTWRWTFAPRSPVGSPPLPGFAFSGGVIMIRFTGKGSIT